MPTAVFDELIQHRQKLEEFTQAAAPSQEPVVHGASPGAVPASAGLAMLGRPPMASPASIIGIGNYKCDGHNITAGVGAVNAIPERFDTAPLVSDHGSPPGVAVDGPEP